MSIAQVHQTYNIVGDGNKAVAVAGTAERLSATPVACKCVEIFAKDTNTKPITVGTSTVVASPSTKRGLPIYPGQSRLFYVTNLNLLWLDSEVNAEAVTFIYYVD